MNAIVPRSRHPRQASTNFVQLQDGTCIDLLLPDFSPVALSVLAYQLSRIPRFAGGTRGAVGYSVAQHSAMVAAHLDGAHRNRALARAGLLHDAHEACTSDIPSPVKRAVPAIAELEARLQAAVFARWGLPDSLRAHPALHEADLAAAATERRDLMARSVWSWGADLPPPWPERLQPWDSVRAHALFMRMAERLELV